MKKTYLLTATLLTSLLLTNCQKSDNTEQVEQMTEKVLAVHDEVMPRMEEIMTLKGKVSTRIDSLSKIAPATANLKNQAEEGIAINKALTEADSLMSDWMYQYNGDTLKGMEKGEAQVYLDAQMSKISAVKEKINVSIGRANKYLQNQP